MDQTFLLHLKPWEQRLSHQISQALAAEKVYVLATSLFIEHTESIFSASRIITRDDDLVYVLILLSGAPQQRASETAKLLEAACSKPVLPLLLSLEDFTSGLRSGDFFCCYVLRNAKLIHDGGFVFSSPAAVDAAVCRYRMKAALAAALEQIGDVLQPPQQDKPAEKNRRLKVAIVMGLQAMFFLGTGFQMESDSIQELLDYCGMVSPEPALLFPRHADEDRRRLTQLDADAGSTSRDADDAQAWIMEKLKLLRDLLENYGRERLLALTKGDRND